MPVRVLSHEKRLARRQSVCEFESEATVSYADRRSLPLLYGPTGGSKLSSRITAGIVRLIGIRGRSNLSEQHSENAPSLTARIRPDAFE